MRHVLLEEKGMEGSPMQDYRIMLAEDHDLVRQGIKKLLSEFPYIEVIGEASDGSELLELLKKSTPDLVILDILMPHLNGVETAVRIKDNFPQIKILFLTMYGEREYLYQAISTGAEGYLLKSDVATSWKMLSPPLCEGIIISHPSYTRISIWLIFCLANAEKIWAKSLRNHQSPHGKEKSSS